jgi:predicted lipid-binding transport protein (Tim44 family)
MNRFNLRSLLALFAVAATLIFLVAEADARTRGNFGSRGTKTYSPPASTTTAPNSARPIERTMTQPNAAQPSAAPRTTGMQQPGGLFNRPGFFGGLAAGFLGAGLIGLLFGQGLFGNLAGLASILGFVVQLALIGGAAWLIVSWWSRRQQQSHPVPAYANASRRQMLEPQRHVPLGGSGASSSGNPARDLGGNLGGSVGGGLGAGLGAAGASPSPHEIEITPADFDAFEQLLGEIQTAYGSEDLATLRSRVTPEVLSYFAEELAENASRGVVNEIRDVKLLQGDLAESWSEGAVDYATVAMRYGLIDRTVERASGKLVDGGETPQEATEVWTFMRNRGGSWLLSAIQQA